MNSGEQKYEAEDQAKTSNEETKAPENESENQQPEVEAKTQEDPNAIALKKSDEQVKEWKDKYLRLLADQQNYKKIVERDIKNAKEFAIEAFAKQMLEVSDNLARGIAIAKKESNTSPSFTSLVDGISMTHTNLHKHFQANQIVEFNPLGEAFDPNRHTALYQRPAQGDEQPNTVVEVMTTGFSFRDRILRASTVGVAVKSS